MKEKIHKHPVRFIALIFLLIGLLFPTAGAVSMGLQSVALKSAIPVQATIVEHSESHTLVRYTVDGVAYETDLSEYFSNDVIGQELTVYYMPNRPDDVFSKRGAFLFSIIFFSVGIIFLITGAVMLFVSLHRQAIQCRVLQEGTRIDAAISAVRLDTTIAVNRRHPYVILCQAQNPDDGKTYTFKSGPLWRDPLPYLTGLSTLSVYVEPDNYRHYALDLTDIVPDSL